MIKRNKTLKNEKAKSEIGKLQKLLNDTVTLDNVRNDVILEISSKLDVLILEYYVNYMQEQGLCS